MSKQVRAYFYGLDAMVFECVLGPASRALSPHLLSKAAAHIRWHAESPARGFYVTHDKTFCMTSTITVRLSEKERRELQKHGKISEVVREALRLYLRNRASKRIVSRLKELQKIAIMRTTIKDDLRLIRTDRER